MGIITRYAQEIDSIRGLDGSDGATGRDGGDATAAPTDPLQVGIIDGIATLDLRRGNAFRITLIEDVIIAIVPGSPTNGQKFSVSLTQDSTGGWAVTWWADPIRWSRGGTPPTITVTPDKRDTFGFEVWDDQVTLSYDGFVIGQDI
jgi:hypothetical protein